MLIEVPKNKGFRKSFEEPKPVWGIDSGGALYIRCGGCGVCVGFDESHTIAADGTVSPSVHHDDGQCGWHVFVKLLDWTPR